MPFQELSRRKRKDVKVEDIQVQVCLFAFDLLYLNGEVSIFFPHILADTQSAEYNSSPYYNFHWTSVVSC